MLDNSPDQDEELKQEIAYKSNINLKKANVELDFEDWQIREIKKCSQDINYFAENYVKVVHPDYGFTAFKPYDYQEEFLGILKNNTRVVANQARQSGKSQTVATFILWEILFKSYHTAAILANKAETAREILNSKLKVSYEALPYWLQQGVVKWNEGSIHLENGSRVLASATSSSAIRGYSVSTLVLDETAHIESKKFQQFFDSVYPTISAGTYSKLVMISTPKGLNHFYKFFNEAKNGVNNFAWMEVDWRRVPGRDEEWAEQERINMGELKFQQEHEVDFLGSSNTLIAPNKIKELTPTRPTLKNDQETYRIYEDTKPGHVYLISCDVSRGKGLDNSAFNVIDITEYPFKQVASYSSNTISPFAYTQVISSFGKHYNEAFVIVENNEIGSQVVDDLNYDLEYENIISDSESKNNSELGVRTTKSTKRKGCATLKELVESEKLVIQDSETIMELSGFIAKNNSYEADAGFTDDLVMSLAVFSWFATQELFSDLTNQDVRQKLREQSFDAEEDLVPFGFIDDGVTEYEQQNDFSVPGLKPQEADSFPWE